MDRCCEGRAITCCMDDCPEERGHAETRIAELERTIVTLRALVDKQRKGLGHAVHLTEHNKGMCVRCREAREKIAAALTEEDMLERLAGCTCDGPSIQPCGPQCKYPYIDERLEEK